MTSLKDSKHLQNIEDIKNSKPLRNMYAALGPIFKSEFFKPENKMDSIEQSYSAYILHRESIEPTMIGNVYEALLALYNEEVNQND